MYSSKYMHTAIDRLGCYGEKDTFISEFTEVLLLVCV